jgi:hypothetical protein
MGMLEGPARQREAAGIAVRALRGHEHARLRLRRRGVQRANKRGHERDKDERSRFHVEFSS